MSAIYENENNEVCVILCENDYIKVITNEKEEKGLIIRRQGDKFLVESLESPTTKPINKKEKEKRKNGSNKMS
ncbi:MAG: hypothetical protein SOX86_03655 [Bacilli bacterium]|nr:hypothetical protein [Bacilli bacterium]